jgi:hypothetical protein
VPDRDDQGPLVADDYGMAVVVGRKRLHAGQPSHHYFFAWSDVVGYGLASLSVGQATDNSMAKTRTTQLTIYTRRDQHRWELPLSPVEVKTNLQRWLAHIPLSA